MVEALFDAPGGALCLVAPDERLLRLADRLWERAGGGRPTSQVELSFSPAAVDAAADPERALRWSVADEVVRLDGAGAIDLVMERSARRARATVSEGLLSAEPALVARLALEAPAAFFATATHQVLHAGALAGPSGAVVLRGAAGAGKSTLVAAGWAAGLTVVSDESLLVDRADPDSLCAAVRDLTLLPVSASLLGLLPLTRAVLSGGEEKRRVDLFAGAAPSHRRARRVATLLLGPREPGPARLVPVDGAALLALFEEGTIPQETAWGGDPRPIAAAWAGRDVFRLDGAADLLGAVEIVTRLTR